MRLEKISQLKAGNGQVPFCDSSHRSHVCALLQTCVQTHTLQGLKCVWEKRVLQVGWGQDKFLLFDGCPS